MSRRVRDTISTVKALQQKIKMMTEQNITAGVITNQQGALYRDDHSIHFGNNTLMVEPNVFSSNTSTTPFNISQLLTPLVHAHQETETSAFQQFEVSPQPVEHAPVRAESRGATPDVRMSSYKSRATSLLFNLKDNRKRVKSTYSPTKFKGLDTVDKSKQSSVQETKETVIDIPNFPGPDMQFLQLEESKRTNAAVNQYYSPGQSLTTHNCQPARLNTGQYPENTANDYQAVQMQGQTVHHSGFSGFMPENYTSNQLANGQNPHEYLVSFTPYKQGVIENDGTLGGPKQPYVTMNTAKQNADNNQSREYLISNTNSEQAFNETVGSIFTKVDRYEQLSVNKHEYNVSLQDKCRQTIRQDKEKLIMKAVVSPSDQETAPSLERLRKEYLPSQNKELEKLELRESFSFGASCHNMAGLIKTNSSYQLQGQQGQKENGLKDVNLTYSDDDYRRKHELYSTTDKIQKTGQIKQYMPFSKACEMQHLQQIEAKPQIENDIQKNSLSNPDHVLVPTMTHQVKDRQLSDVKGEQLMAEQRKAQHTPVDLAKAQLRAQVEQPTAESAGLMLAAQVDSEKIKTEDSESELPKLETVRQAKEEHIKEEKKIREQTEKSREKQPEQAREEQTKVEATNLTYKKTNIKEKEKEKKIHVLDMTENQRKQVKAEQAETEKSIEEHIKTNLEKTEPSGPERIKQHKNEQATDKRNTTEQVDEEQLRAEQFEGEPEQIRTKKVNVEQAGTEHGKAEQRDEIRQTQSNPKHMKTEEVELGDVKTVNIKTEDDRQAKTEKDSIHIALVNADKPATQISTTRDTTLEERRAQEADKKLEKTKLEKTKAELSKTENLLERSAKLTAKLAATQQVRSEPDKVEQVKTELAKAKAELAKIKEKMKDKQKEKVKTNLVLKENDTSNDSVPVRTHLDKNNKQELAVQIQTDRVADDYDKLREKYGFTSSVSLGNKVSTTESGPLNDASKTKVTPTDKVEEENEKLKDGHGPTSPSMIANKDSKDKVSSFKDSEVTESPRVYSESSKELKLSSVSSFPTSSKRANEGSVADKHKNDSVEKCDSFKDAVSQQRDPDLGNLHPTEIKSKSTEHSADPEKHLHVTPPRVLPHKERAQTKQEILTSKIKAHAEKEISAIKEKGFALREGFIGKSSTKPFAGQNFNIRQRPPSEEMSNKGESTVSSSLSLKYQKEPPGVQMEPAKLVSPLSSATIPVKSVITTTQLADHSEKPRKSNQTMSTTDGLLVQKELGTISAVQNKEPASKDNQGKEQGYHGEISGKLQQELDNNQATDSEIRKRTEDPTQATHVKAASSKPFTTEKAECKEAAYEDSAPLNIETGQREASEADNNLQIMGIMVTVRERKPSVNIDQGNNCTKKQINVMDCSKSELDQWNLSTGLEENTPTKVASFVKDMVVQKTDSTIGADQAQVEQNNLPESFQKTSAMEATTNMSGSVTEKETSLQSSTVNAKPKSETQPKSLTKDVPLTAVGAKDKVLADTQPAVFKQDTETKENTNKTEKENLSKSTGQVKKEEKDQQQMQTANVNENFTAKVVNSGSHSNRAQTIKQNMSVKDDMTATGNNSHSSNIDGRSAPLPEEKRHDSMIPSITSAENENQHVSSKLKNKQRYTENNSQDDDNVHIDSIAIRVVPAVTDKDIKKMFTSDMDTDKKHKLDVVYACEEKANSLSDEHCSKDLTPANSEQMKESMEKKLAVQHVLSSVRQLSDSNKIGSKQSTTNTANNESDNQKPESSIQTVDEDYFQVQRITETHNQSHNNTIIVGDNVADTSKERELQELLPNKTATSNESCKEGKSETFGFSVDQRDCKEDKASPASCQDENRRKNLETEDPTQDSKLSDGSLERWSKNGKKETSQPNQIRRKQTDTLTSLSATDRQGSRNSHPTNTNTVEEKSEPKLKTKERVSTIPEISAIADYARLKVIVSDNKEVNPVQEFPPNKKEGFFPLIQTRHSRRPVFTVDPQDLSVKEKSLSNKTELSSKVNKESKALIFPIMGKDHQRTGMFKLGDKEKQEKMPLDVKMNVDILDNAAKYPDYKGTDKSSTAQTEIDGACSQRSDQGTVQRNNHSLEAKSSSPAANKTKNISEGFTYFVRNSPPHSTLGQMQYRKENTTHLRNDERTELQQEKHMGTKTEGDRKEQVNKERLTPQQEDIKTKQHDKRQLEEEYAFRSEKKQKEEKMKIKHIIQESRASLAEEERKATQREEERRTREREAVAIMIKQKRENQRQVEGRTGEERTAKQSEEERFDQKSEKIQPNKWKEEIRHQRRAAEEEQRKATQEEQQRRDVEEQERTPGEQHKKDAEEQQKRASQEEQMNTAAVEKQRKVAEEQQQRATEEQRRKFAEEQQRKSAEKHQKNVAEEELKRVAVEQQRIAAERQQKRAAEEWQRKVAEEQHRKAAEEQQKRAAEAKQRKAEEQKRRAADEQQRKDAEKQQRKVSEEQQIRTAEEKQRRAEEEQQQRAAEEHQRKVAEEQQRRAVEEHQRKVIEEQQRRAAEEHQRKVAEEQQRRASEEDQRKVAKEQQRREEEQQRKVAEEQQKRAAEEHQIKVAEEQQRRAEEEKQRRAEEEQQRRAAEEHQRKVAEEQQRKVAEEQQRRAAEEHQRKVAKEQQRKFAEKQQRRTAEEHQRKVAEEQQQRAEEEQQRRAEEVQQRKVAEEQQRRAAEKLQRRAAEEKQRKVAEEQQRRAEEEQQRKDAEEQQRRAAEQQQRKVAEEQQRRAAEKLQRRAAEEKQRKVAEEQQRRAEEEQKRKVAEEQQIRAEEEQQRKVAEEQQQRAAEQQQRKVSEEQQRRATEEHQRKVAEEQQRRAAEKLQKRAAEEQQRRAEEGQQRRAAEEHHRKVAEMQHRKVVVEQQRGGTEEQQSRAEEEQQRRVAQEKLRKVAEEQQTKVAEEQYRKVAEEQQQRAEEQQKKIAREQQRKAAQIEEQRQLKLIKDAMLTDIVEGAKRLYRERDESYISEDETVMQIQEHIKVQEHTDEQKRTYKPHMREKWTKTRNEEEEEKEAAERKKIMKQDEKEAKYESTRQLKDKRITQESIANRDNEIQAKMKDENFASQREKARAAQMEKQKRVAQKMDGLQYYAIADTERKPRERQQFSPLPSQQGNSPLELESADKSASHPRPYRLPASPAPSLPRSNTSSPALGAKPSMFRVKDNTFRGSSLTKSVKPCFHKSFGEDFRVGSPLDKFSDRGEDEQEIMRRSAGTPIHPDTGSNRFTAVNESLTLSTASLQNYSTSTSHHRPYSRRSIVMDEDESRSVISNISEDMESIATSVADLADVRGLTDFDRPESACSFSSDVSRSMGKPPAVPPKSEKALRRAQRLTSRRIKKELSKVAAGSPTGVEKEVLNVPSSFTE
ncbi:titin homolog isoform X2 [Melanotaenia boesemani]|nr:titin homolog isoform X2 [Melanotaenia boesemani]